MAKKKLDVYSQIMSFDVTMSAANTLTFGQIAVGVSIFDYAIFKIQRIEYEWSLATLELLTDNADQAVAAITGSDTITALTIDKAEVYDRCAVYVADFGTPASAHLYNLPSVKDFTAMPGGGLVVPAQDVYMGVTSQSLGSAGRCTARMYYTIEQVDASDYLELAQRYRVLST